MRRGLLALAVTLGWLAAACGGARPAAVTGPSPVVPSGTPVPLVTPGVAGGMPGHGSPAAAFTGFFDAAAAGDVAALCSYVAPGQQARCPAAFGGVTIGPQGAPLRLGQTFTVGTRALVVPLGTICTAGSCTTNADPRLGLPASDAGFDAAYTAATTTDISTVPCEQDGGQWYVVALALPGA